MTSSPEVDGPAKTVGICLSSEAASDSAPWSKNVVPSVALGPILSVAGSKVTGEVDEEGFSFSCGTFTEAIASCFNSNKKKMGKSH